MAMSENLTASTDRSASAEEADPELSTFRRVVEWLANRNSFAIVGAFLVSGLTADHLGVPEPADNVLYLIGGVLPLVLATVSTTEDGYDHDLSNWTRAKIIASQLAWSVTPWGLLTQVLQLGGTAVAYIRHRGRPPNRTRRTPTTEFSVPVESEWTVTNGGVTKSTSHSWGLVSQRYAYDLVITDDNGDTHEGNGQQLVDYYAFGAPVTAPADGTIVAVEDGLRDHPVPGSARVEWRTWNIVGNHVVIEHDDGEYSTLAHLREGSVTVSPGERVSRGDVVGECGNSGMSTEPHLHFQVQDHANVWIAAGLVPRFRNVELSRPDDRRTDHDVYDAPDTAETLYLWAGDRVTAGSEGGESA
jgi:murein DD-endopeptidase MepM/ murein hydrolase activator NlpD